MGLGSGIWDPRSRIRDPGSRIQDPGSRIQDPGPGILDPGSGIRDSGYGIRDTGSGIRDTGSGSRKKPTPNPGSRGKKGTGSPIWPLKNVFCCLRNRLPLKIVFFISGNVEESKAYR